MKRVRVRRKPHAFTKKSYHPTKGLPALRESAKLYPEQPGVDYQRPKTRADCRGLGGPGKPCPWAGCKHHLFLDVMPNGTLRIVDTTVEPHQMEWSCCLAVVEAHPDGMPDTAVAAIVKEHGSGVARTVRTLTERLRLPVLRSAL